MSNYTADFRPVTDSDVASAERGYLGAYGHSWQDAPIAEVRATYERHSASDTFASAVWAEAAMREIIRREY